MRLCSLTWLDSWLDGHLPSRAITTLSLSIWAAHSAFLAPLSGDKKENQKKKNSFVGDQISSNPHTHRQIGQHTRRRPQHGAQLDDVKRKLSAVWIPRCGLCDADAQLGNLVCRWYQQLENRQSVWEPDGDELHITQGGFYGLKADGSLFHIHTNVATQTIACDGDTSETPGVCCKISHSSGEEPWQRYSCALCASCVGLIRHIHTFRCMNLCRGSYQSSRTTPDGTAAQRKVLSVYGFLAGRQESQSCVAAAVSLTMQNALTCAAPATAFGVRNLRRHGKLPAQWVSTFGLPRQPHHEAVRAFPGEGALK